MKTKIKTNFGLHNHGEDICTAVTDTHPKEEKTTKVIAIELVHASILLESQEDGKNVLEKMVTNNGIYIHKAWATAGLQLSQFHTAQIQ